MFFVEGEKLTNEVINELKNNIICLCTLKKDKYEQFSHQFDIYETSEAQMKEISALKNPGTVLCVLRFPELRSNISSLSLALDQIQDPGNFGTIWRLADWFGISKIYCSPDTVDCYNPKVIQASMGAFARVSVEYTNIPALLEKSKLTSYGAFLEGDNIYETKLDEESMLVLGNEGNGISNECAEFIKHKITIPRFGAAESLNVSTAAAILISEFKRRI